MWDANLLKLTCAAALMAAALLGGWLDVSDCEGELELGGSV